MILPGLRWSQKYDLHMNLTRRLRYKNNLPFTFWTDLDNKQPPFVEVTEGGIFMGHNRLINWNWIIWIYYLQ